MINRFQKFKTKSGFTLIEIMIVVAIIALLAAIAIPNYTRHTQRARASEAIATMTMIRQAIRDYFIVTSVYYDVASGNLDQAPTTGVSVDVGIAQYFSNAAFSIDGTSPSSVRFASPTAVDFIISVDGSASVACGTSNCAIHNAIVSDYRLEMDNTARTYVSYDAGTSWMEY